MLGWWSAGMHCIGRGMSVSPCTRYEKYFPIVCVYEDVEYENYHSTIAPRFDGQQLPEFGPSLVIFRYSFKHLYFADGFDY